MESLQLYTCTLSAVAPNVAFETQGQSVRYGESMWKIPIRVV